MKRKLTALSQRYVTALSNHLSKGPRAGVRSAHSLGRQAVAIGLETLDVAKIHQEALATIEASSSSDGLIKRAEFFFKEAITPIEKIHHSAVKASVHLNQLDQELVRRTGDLALSNRSLRQSIVRRKK